MWKFSFLFCGKLFPFEERGRLFLSPNVLCLPLSLPLSLGWAWHRRRFNQSRSICLPIGYPLPPKARGRTYNTFFSFGLSWSSMHLFSMENIRSRLSGSPKQLLALDISFPLSLRETSSSFPICGEKESVSISLHFDRINLCLLLDKFNHFT